ncbi:MAG: transcription elongation factor GreA [Parcubacteria group bacterium]|nr:transcription elongation factor GreA [Parcubacteria group bacterium]
MSRYLSSQDLEKSKEELKALKGPKRKEIARRIEEAKSLGDLSENAEYHDAREAQSFNEGRILELEEVIKNAVIIEQDKGNKSGKISVEVGDSVEVVDAQGQKTTFIIVGSNGTDPSQNKISNESPLGRAFVSRLPGEEVEVLTPRGKVKYKILRIK